MGEGGGLEVPTQPPALGVEHWDADPGQGLRFACRSVCPPHCDSSCTFGEGHRLPHFPCEP